MNNDIIKFIFNNEVCCKSEIYDLINAKIYNKYRINSDEIKNFITSLDHFIIYFSNNFLIERSEISYVLELILKNANTRILNFNKINIHNETNYEKFIYKYKYIIVKPFFKNLKFLIKHDKFLFKNFKTKEKYNLNHKEDVDDLFELLKFVINTNYKSILIFYIFDNYNKYTKNKNKLDMYINFWSTIIDNYNEKKHLLEQLTS